MNKFCGNLTWIIFINILTFLSRSGFDFGIFGRRDCINLNDNRFIIGSDFSCVLKEIFDGKLEWAIANTVVIHICIFYGSPLESWLEFFRLFIMSVLMKSWIMKIVTFCPISSNNFFIFCRHTAAVQEEKIKQYFQLKTFGRFNLPHQLLCRVLYGRDVTFFSAILVGNNLYLILNDLFQVHFFF